MAPQRAKEAIGLCVRCLQLVRCPSSAWGSKASYPRRAQGTCGGPRRACWRSEEKVIVQMRVATDLYGDVFVELRLISLIRSIFLFLNAIFPPPSSSTNDLPSLSSGPGKSDSGNYAIAVQVPQRLDLHMRVFCCHSPLNFEGRRPEQSRI